MSDIPDFTVYSVGLVNASVCSKLSIEETTERLNIEHPTGIASRWMLSKKKRFSDGRSMPCACERYPDTHKHYLFHC